MNICPLCSKVYSDDDVFCYEDGNALVEEGDEQETRPIPFAGKRPGVEPPHPFPGPEHSPEPEPGAPRYGDTIPFKPPVFKTPQDGNRSTTTSNKMGVITAFGVGAVVLTIVLIGMYGIGGGGDRGRGGNVNLENKNVASPSPRAILPNTFDRKYTGTIGNQDLSMNLKKDGATLTGTAETTKLDTLSGTIQDNGEFTADSSPIGKAATGKFTGRIKDDGSIEGKWTDRQGGRETPFRVEE